MGSVTEVLVIVGVSGWSSRTSSDLKICGGVYGPRRILSASEGPKDLEGINSQVWFNLRSHPLALLLESPALGQRHQLLLILR